MTILSRSGPVKYQAHRRYRLGTGLVTVAAAVLLTGMGQTAALHASGTLELEFVQQLVDVFAAVFVEANRCEAAQEREKTFRAGCARALQELLT